ncbi:uncharacterized protein PV06_04073 [Exophiala oligosperma]|uniref:Uncharacterized protein n=1 Tax=Exophiala oligosperma TaxID=215243 RepID=A0A0D2DT66_9EURO|nr:uncharacterized protein PV06_04073 [Exophiala oligosperma]KIW45705.1 hypothetical protein PV06_04073 [Exophiala oligosperma]
MNDRQDALTFDRLWREKVMSHDLKGLLVGIGKRHNLLHVLDHEASGQARVSLEDQLEHVAHSSSHIHDGDGIVFLDGPSSLVVLHHIPLKRKLGIHLCRKIFLGRHGRPELCPQPFVLAHHLKHGLAPETDARVVRAVRRASIAVRFQDGRHHPALGLHDVEGRHDPVASLTLPELDRQRCGRERAPAGLPEDAKGGETAQDPDEEGRGRTRLFGQRMEVGLAPDDVEEIQLHRHLQRSVQHGGETEPEDTVSRGQHEVGDLLGGVEDFIFQDGPFAPFT